MILDILFPKFCLSCKKKWAYLCPKCKKKLTMHQEICHICHKKSDGFELHSRCKDESNLEVLYIWFDYNKSLKKILVNFKYHHRKVLIEVLWNLLYINFLANSKINLKNTIITYIPMHFVRKHFIKGYNQAEILANYLWEKLDLSVIELCKKRKYTRPQAWLDRKKRLKNLDNSFVSVVDDLDSVEKIIIVDDITTTGSTLEELASCIKKNHPKIQIYGLVLARH